MSAPHTASQTRIRELALELNNLRIERDMEEQRRREREAEILTEMVRLTVNQ